MKLKKVEEKKVVIESVDLRIPNLLIDIDVIRMYNIMPVNQHNIYCNSARRLYVKMIELHHFTKTCSEQHHKLLHFLVIKNK